MVRAFLFQEVHMLPTQTSQAGVFQISVALITPKPKQPRKHFDLQELEHLIASIKEHGVIQPLLVCLADRDGIHILKCYGRIFLPHDYIGGYLCNHAARNVEDR